jgi:hypothetical protein
MVLALDDTEAVWRGSPVLLIVDPYQYFRGSKDINNSAGASMGMLDAGGPSITELAGATQPPSPRGTEENRPHLLDALRVFNSVHRAYFSCYGVDIPVSQYEHGVAATHTLDGAIKAGMASDNSSGSSPSADSVMHAAYLMQRLCQTILRGVVVVFSGVFPLGCNLQKQLLYRRAVAFGASVVDAMSDRVTHVVCRSYGTAKTQAAEKLLTVRVVTAEWLQDCIRQYRRVPEAAYTFAAAKVAKCASKPHPHTAGAAAKADAHFDKYFSEMLAQWRAKQAANLAPVPALDTSASKRSRPDDGYMRAVDCGGRGHSDGNFTQAGGGGREEGGGDIDMGALEAAMADSDDSESERFSADELSMGIGIDVGKRGEAPAGGNALGGGIGTYGDGVAHDEDGAGSHYWLAKGSTGAGEEADDA